MSEGEGGAQNMDKKSARYASGPPKGNGTDSKKDVSNTTSRFPRQHRRKDGASHSYDQPGPNKRQPVQKNRFMDKRPRARGVHNGNSRDEMTTMEGTDPEYGSAQNWGSKKSNLSHLLNFHFEPRDISDRGGRGGRGSYYSRGKGRSFKGQTTRYNKEHFIQANCQFIVKESGDYSVHTVDPDTLVDWDLIEQVRTFSNSEASCPICLFPPTAAKITRCGHVYCAPCILHYLSLGEKPWRRCPICYDAVIQKDLKSVVSLETHMYTAGQEITMKLMKRKRGTTLTLPIDQWSDNDGQLYNMNCTEDSHYVKLLAASPSQVQHMLDIERHALRRQLEDEVTDSLEGSYIQAALDLLQERQNHVSLAQGVAEDLDEQFLKLNVTDEETSSPQSVISTTKRSPDMKAVVYSSAFSDDEESAASNSAPHETPETGSQSDDSVCIHGNHEDEDADIPVKPDEMVTMDDVDLGMSSDVSMTTDESFVEEELMRNEAAALDGRAEQRQKADYYYFFQAADGQHIYPHSINARCLVKEYGSLDNCPRTIAARIVELDHFTMNDDLRHRMRYLSHLPVTCEFQVAELALKPPLVSKETIKLFFGEIDRRKKQRQRKSREEKRQSRRIQEQEHRELGIDRSARIVPSVAPTCTTHITHIVPSATTVTDSTTAVFADVNNSVGSTPTGSPPDVAELATSPISTSSEDGGQTSSLSFAQMLRAGKAKTPDPWVKTGASGGAAVQDKTRTKASGSESENEDRVPVPMYGASFGDAIQQALDKYHQPGSEVVEDVAPPTPSSGKKKKKQKTLLFATTMNRMK